jgi:hypothetical protein
LNPGVGFSVEECGRLRQDRPGGFSPGWHFSALLGSALALLPPSRKAAAARAERRHQMWFWCATSS